MSLVHLLPTVPTEPGGVGLPGRSRVRRRYLVLLALRWFPVGLWIPITILLPLDRGLTLAEVGLAASLQGFVVLALELPTGGLADSWGGGRCWCSRRASRSASMALLLFADTFAGSRSSSRCRASSGRWTAGRSNPGTSTPRWPPTRWRGWSAG